MKKRGSLSTEFPSRKIYIVGGGIASLSAAVYLIKDGKTKGVDITVLEEFDSLGGSLDAQNLSSSEGYEMRGIRMFEEKAYNCLFDLMSVIPSLNAPGKTLRQEFTDYNRKNRTYSKARLLKDKRAVDGRPLKLSLKDRVNLLTLWTKKESSIEDLEIRDYFTSSFFTSNFWFEFCTVFSFQPWHSLIEFKRYFFRFIQSFSVIDTLESIESSPYNQYEFLVLPIVDWLRKEGVVFATGTKVVDLEFKTEGETRSVRDIRFENGNGSGAIPVGNNDLVLVTLGSLVANSSTGSMTQAPLALTDKKDAAWTLWENISKDRPEFGKPSVFDSHIDRSKWTSFTITFRDRTFFNLIEKFIHKDVNAYGGVNLIESNWLLSIVLSYKPYYLNQPKDIDLCWGYGLFSDKEGNFVKKKMSECTGEEILTELVHHLGFQDSLKEILGSAVCIPCAMPYITSLFLPRKKLDRPEVIPKGSLNFAFLGQYCEIPHEVVFTVEHSVRSAQIAVYSLLKLNKKVAPIYRGTRHIAVLSKALRTLFR